MSTRERDRVDPDELALLEEERDHLLASLDDLEREYAAGDLDEVDYLELRDDYTVRAADVLEAIEHRRVRLRDAAPPTSVGRRVVVSVAVLAFAVLAGVLVARGSGQRGDAPITGGTGDLRSRLVSCRTTSFRDPARGIDCYAEVLEEAPDNVEALTYQGWAMIRADRVRDGAANLERVVEIDPDYPDVRVFRAVVASRAGDLEAAAAEIDRFYRNDPAPAAVQVLRSQGLEREIFVRLLDEDTRGCWVEAAAATSRAADGGAGPGDEGGAGDEGDADAEEFLSGLGGCLDRVLAEHPTSVDALVSRAYASLAGSGDLQQGTDLAARALRAAPQDPNALLLHASVALADGRAADARADLDQLERLPRPTASFLIGGPEELSALVEEATTAATSTTTTTRPDGPRVPNRDGG